MAVAGQRGHVTAQRVCQLYGGRADAAGRAPDQDPLPAHRVHAVPQRDQRRGSRDDQGGRFDRRDVHRGMRDAVRGHHDVLGRSTGGVPLPGMHHAPHPVPDPVTRDIGAGLDDGAREVQAHTDREPPPRHHLQLPRADDHVMPVHAGRLDRHQDFAGSGRGTFDVIDPQDIRSTETRDLNGLHVAVLP